MKIESIVNEYRSKNPIIKKLFLRRINVAVKLADATVKNQNNASIIDIGCGEGMLLKLLRKEYPSLAMTGIDIEPTVLTLQDKVQADIRVMSVTDMKFPDKSFDVAFCLDTLEHIPQKELESGVSEIKRILKTNGKLITSLPTETAFYKFCRLLAKGTTSAETGPCSSPHFHTAKEVENLLRISGFKQIKQKRLPPVPFFALFHITMLDCPRI